MMQVCEGIGEKLKDKKIYNTALYCRLSLDDGYSGLIFNRPGFQRIIKEYQE